MSAGSNSVALLFSFESASSPVTGSAAVTLAFAVPTSAVGSCDVLLPKSYFSILVSSATFIALTLAAFSAS